MKKNNNDRRKLPKCLLANFVTLNFKKLKISVKQGMIVTTLFIIKHYISYLM